MYCASDFDECGSLAFIEFAQESLSSGDFADLVSDLSVSSGYLHRQESIFPNGDARQARLLKASIVLHVIHDETKIP